MTDAPGELYAVKCDLTKEEQILEAFNWVKENLGPVHILVNNAGFIRPTNLIGTPYILIICSLKKKKVEKKFGLIRIRTHTF